MVGFFKSLVNGYACKHRLETSFLITMVSILVVSYFNVPNPAIICLIAVVFSTFLGGFTCGSLSGVLTIIYCGYYFSIPNNLFCYTNENLYKMAVIILAIPMMIFMVGTLKKQVDTRTQELEVANERFRLLSTVDGLTGVLNRRYFEQLLDNEWRRSLRDGTPLSLAMIDVDFFKNYNDTYGHQAGDECLRQIANEIVNRTHRPGDFTARYGGEEFVVLLSNTSIKGALKVGEDIRQLIEKLQIPHRASAVKQYITLSIGVVSVVPTEGNTLSDFVKKADVALYHAKRCGRNKVQPYSEQAENYCLFE